MGKSKRRYEYTKNPHQTVPDHIARWLRELRDGRVGANHTYTAALIAVRGADWGIPAIGAAVGMEPVTLARRICRGRRHPAVQAALAALAVDVPKAPVSSLRHPYVTAKPLPANIAKRLRELRADSRFYRAGMPADNPYRVAADQLAAEVTDLAKTYSLSQIAKGVGVTLPPVKNWIRRHERLTADSPASHAA